MRKSDEWSETALRGPDTIFKVRLTMATLKLVFALAFGTPTARFVTEAALVNLAISRLFQSFQSFHRFAGGTSRFSKHRIGAKFTTFAYDCGIICGSICGQQDLKSIFRGWIGVVLNRSTIAESVKAESGVCKHRI